MQPLRVLLRLLNQSDAQIYPPKKKHTKQNLVVKSCNLNTDIDLCNLHKMQIFTSVLSSLISLIFLYLQICPVCFPSTLRREGLS